MNKNAINLEVHQNDFKTIHLTDRYINTDPILTRAVSICSKLVRFIEMEHIFVVSKLVNSSVD